MKIIPTALAIVGIAMIGPTMAAAQNDGSSVKMKPGALYNYVPGVLNIGPNGPGTARDQAIHDCSTQASQWSFSTGKQSSLPSMEPAWLNTDKYRRGLL